MRASVLQENFRAALALAGKATATKSTLPVLGNVLIGARDGSVFVAGTNLNVSVCVRIAAKVEDEGATTMPARLLRDLVNAMPPERVDLEHRAKSESLHLVCGRAEATVKGITAKDFPMLATLTGDNAVSGQTVTVMPAELRRMVREVAFAASVDESSQRFTNVQIELNENRLKMVATDGYRLAIATGEALGGELREPVLIPARTMELVIGMLGDADPETPVQMVLPENNTAQVVFAFSGPTSGRRATVQSVEVVAQRYAGKFPDYRAIIPKNTITRSVVPVAPFLRALKTSALFVKNQANIVQIALKPGEPGALTVAASGGDDLGDVCNEIEAVIEGDPLEMSFNVKYLSEYLAQCDAPEFEMRTTMPTRPAQMVPVGAEVGESMHVIMPMHPPREQ